MVVILAKALAVISALRRPLSFTRRFVNHTQVVVGIPAKALVVIPAQAGIQD
jgi:hypothetical protein